jgi:hypothetical protein
MHCVCVCFFFFTHSLTLLDLDAPPVSTVVDVARTLSDLVSLVHPVSIPDVTNTVLFMWKQAQGAPTGLHAFFQPYHIDSFTMKVAMQSASPSKQLSLLWF